jgi:predicted Holliday junction resolvase-like endonuclease
MNCMLLIVILTALILSLTVVIIKTRDDYRSNKVRIDPKKLEAYKKLEKVNRKNYQK